MKKVLKTIGQVIVAGLALAVFVGIINGPDRSYANVKTKSQISFLRLIQTHRMWMEFDIRNDNNFPVKDLTIRCDYYGPSGTAIDYSSKTIYEVIPAHQNWRGEMDMGRVDGQTDSHRCRMVGYS